MKALPSTTAAGLVLLACAALLLGVVTAAGADAAAAPQDAVPAQATAPIQMCGYVQMVRQCMPTFPPVTRPVFFPCDGGAPIVYESYNASPRPAQEGFYRVTVAQQPPISLCMVINNQAVTLTNSFTTSSYVGPFTDCSVCQGTPASTSTPSLTPLPTSTPTITLTPTETPLPTETRTPTVTRTVTLTPEPTDTPLPTLTPTVTATGAPTRTPTVTRTVTLTPEPTNTGVPTSTPTRTLTSTPAPPTATVTPTATFSASSFRIEVDRGPGSLYQLGETIRINYYLPYYPALIEIWRDAADGSRRLTAGSVSGPGAITGVLAAPSGGRTFRLVLLNSAGQPIGQQSVSISVADQVSITAGRSTYAVGELAALYFSASRNMTITISECLGAGPVNCTPLLTYPVNFGTTYLFNRVITAPTGPRTYLIQGNVDPAPTDTVTIDVIQAVTPTAPPPPPPTLTPPPTWTPVPTWTPTRTPTSTVTRTVPPTITRTATATSTETRTPTVAPTATRTPTLTATSTSAVTATRTPTVTSTLPTGATLTPVSVTPTSTAAGPTTTRTPTPTASVTVAPTGTPTVTVTRTPTLSPTPSATPTASPTLAPTSTATATVPPALTATTTPTRTPGRATPTPEPGCPPDAWEPNNGFPQAQPMSYGETYVGAICPTEDLDLFRLSVRPGDEITLRLSNQPAAYAMYLYNDQASEVAAAEDIVPGDKVIRYRVEDAPLDGAEYYVLILTRSLDYNPEQLYSLLATRVTLMMTSTPTVTATQAAPATPTATQNAPQLTSTPTMTATATPTRTRTLTVTPGPSPTPRPQTVRLFLPYLSREVLGVDANLPTLTPTPTPTLAPTLTRTPTLGPTPTATEPPATCADIYEPDNTQSQARPIVVGAAPQLHTIHTALDADWTVFNAEVGVTYVIQVSDPAPNLDAVLSVYSSAGLRVAVKDDGVSGQGETLEFTPATSGAYAIRVGDYNPGYGECSATYKLSVRR